jgi:hypothetical protein
MSNELPSRNGTLNPDEFPSHSGNLDPNAIPPMPETAIPQQGTPEYKAEQLRIRNLLRSDIDALSQSIGDRPYSELTPKEKVVAEAVSSTMTPTDKEVNGHRLYSNDRYNSHPVSEGRPHFINTPIAVQIYQFGQHAKNERELAEQAAAQQRHQAKADAQAAENQRRADEQQRMQDEARQQILDAENAAKAAEANARANAPKPQTEQQKADNSANALNSILGTLDNFDGENLKLDDATLLGELNAEDLHRLHLETDAWLKAHPDAANKSSIGVLRGRVYGLNNTAAIVSEKSQPDNRFNKITDEFDAKQDRLERERRAEALAHPEQESEGMQALHKYMVEANRVKGLEATLGTLVGKRKERAQQLALIESIGEDGRALRAFMKSGLIKDRRVMESAKESYRANRRARDHVQDLHATHRVEAVDKALENEPLLKKMYENMERGAAPIDGQRELVTTPDLERSMPNPADFHSYDEFRDAVHAFNRLAPLGPKGPSAAHRKVMAYFANPEKHGDMLSEPGSLADRFVAYAQRNELAKEVKGDKDAEAELRRHGVHIPRLATNRQKSKARIDRVNNAYDTLTGSVRKGIRRLRRK